MREDCFACKRRKSGKYFCGALMTCICETRVCPFFKTAEEYVKGFKGYPEYRDICRMYGVEPKK